MRLPGRLASQGGNLLDGALQRMPIVGIARHRLHADHEVVAVGGGDADFHAEFVALARLALGHAFHFRRMHAVELVLVVPLLHANPMGDAEQVDKARVRVRPARKVALDIAHDAPQVCFEPLLLAPDAVHLARMGIPVSQQKRRFEQPFVALA